MSPKHRLIIDTDPGIDDTLAMLLAFSAAADEEVEIPLISVTFGNVGIQDCLRNVATIFHNISAEREWRRKRGMPEGFDVLRSCKPLVAVGADKPLQDQLVMSDFFRMLDITFTIIDWKQRLTQLSDGKDGLGGTHSSHPNFSPSESWKQLFGFPSEPNAHNIPAAASDNALFTPSTQPAHKEILRILRENPEDTITIVAIGPLTNLAVAAAEDPEVFLKAKNVVVMGGALDVHGNITPLAEFNTHADAVAAARVFALTSPNPITTMPPAPRIASPTGGPSSPPPPYLPAYPPQLPRRLNLSLLPLDITTEHALRRADFTALAEPLANAGSPLAAWATAFLAPTFRGMGAIAMHDPLALHFALSPAADVTPAAPRDEAPVPALARKLAATKGGWEVRHGVDVRVETAGQWTRGACITDRRGVPRSKGQPGVDLTQAESGDHGGWLREDRGNRVSVVVKSPGNTAAEFGKLLCRRIFGVEGA